MLGFTLLVLLLVYAIKWAAKNIPVPQNYPPGPPGLLSFLQLGKINKTYPFKAMAKLSRHYGPVLGLRLVHRKMVCVSGYEAVKEVLSNDKLQGRPNIVTFNMRTSGKQLGLLMSQGELWKEHRRFTLRHLRDFGFGKTSLEVLMHEEITDLVTELSTGSRKSQNVNLTGFFSVSVVNILWTMVAGTRFQRSDPRFQNLLQVIEDFFRASSGIPTIAVLIPQIRYVAPESSGFNKLKQITETLRQFIKETIDDHLKTMIEDESRDLLDVYLLEMKKQSNNPLSTFTMEQIYGVVLDIFTAGAETSSNALGFALLYMIYHPEVQQKVHEEIDAVCQGRLPSAADRPNLHYVEATLTEVHRMCTVAPLTIPHIATADTSILGYSIPKNATVFVNIDGVHMDDRIWEEPQVFRPERHLDSSGSFVKHEHILPFGGGKRSCLGEALARTSLFYFFTGVMQKFRFALPSGSYEDHLKPDLSPLPGLSLAPKPFVACVEQRF